MNYRTLADLTVLLHFGFVLFVVVGGLLVLRWPRLRWMHLPAAVWGVLIEFFGWICPLTPLENHLRDLRGQSGYAGGFIDHYIVSVLYPEADSPGAGRSRRGGAASQRVRLLPRLQAGTRSPEVG
jgi:hypothetical protein